MNLNNIQLKDFMCGCLLGDGFLRKQYQNATFFAFNSNKRKEYLLWKKDTIEHNLDVELRYNEYVHRIYNNYICRIDSRTHKYFTKLYNIFYQNNKKIIPTDFVEKYFDKIGLAILYMDCGCTSWRKQYGTIKMCEILIKSFKKEDIEFLQRILIKKFNIYSTISNNNVHRLRIYGNNAINIIEIIKPIVYKVPCMRYKVEFDCYMNVN